MVAAILAGVVISPRRLDAPEWARRAASAGAEAAAIGTVETGAVETGTVETGAVAIGMAATGTAIGVIITTMMSSLSVASVFRGGGAGAHLGDMDLTAMGTRTGTMGTATAIRMAMAAMDMATTAMVMVTAMAMGMGIATVANTLLPLGREWPSCNDDSPVQATIGGQSMESWGLRRGEQSGLTRRPTVTQADLGFFPNVS
jgi:hypothetical protein